VARDLLGVRVRKRFAHVAPHALVVRMACQRRRFGRAI
jgi:hypothetical protein